MQSTGTHKQSLSGEKVDKFLLKQQIKIVQGDDSKFCCFSQKYCSLINLIWKVVKNYADENRKNI